MPKNDYSAAHALDPCFDVMMKGLSKYVDGAHYFDTLADDVFFEFLYEFPEWPRLTRGRANVISLYSGYGDNILLERGDALAVHPSDDGHVVTLEYEVHGKILKTGVAYDNRLSRLLLLRTARSCAGVTTWILWRLGQR